MAVVDRNARHRRHVMWPDHYDEVGVHQFMVLLQAGMKPKHRLLDIGCGSLCGGRYSILYLDEGNYTGVEPHTFSYEDAERLELGNLVSFRKANLCSYIRDFRLSQLGLVGKELNFPGPTYDVMIATSWDFLMAHSIFTHTSQAEAHTLMVEAAKVMHPGSVFMASYYWGSVCDDFPEWRYPAGVSYSHEFMDGLAAEAGLQVERIEPWTKHPVGHTWLRLTK